MPKVTSTDAKSRLVRVTKTAYELVMKEAVRRGLTMGDAATAMLTEWEIHEVQPRLFQRGKLHQAATMERPRLPIFKAGRKYECMDCPPDQRGWLNDTDGNQHFGETGHAHYKDIGSWMD